MFQNKYFTINHIFFYLLLVFNLVNIWSVDIYATMDGPAHLYNAGLLHHIGNSLFLQEYYELNEFFLPNYLPHFILSKLFLFFEPFVAEKIFLSLIVVFLPLSFKYASHVLSGRQNKLSFLVFSLVFTFLFGVGFFNFSLAFIFMNCQVILTHFIITNKNSWIITTAFILTNLALFYTHPFVYALSTGIVFLYSVASFKLNLRELAKKTFILFLLCLPTIIFFIAFIIKVNVLEPNQGDVDITVNDKLAELNRFACGVSYIASEELIYTTLLALLFIFLTSYFITTRFLIGKEIRTFLAIDIFLILAVVTIAGIFFKHNGSYGGMFTNRLTYLFFYLLVFWLACNKMEAKGTIVFVIIIFLFSYGKLALIRHDVLVSLSERPKDIAGARAIIKEGSVVYSINYCDNWFEAHYANYAAINRKVVITENYEARLGWFPLKWKGDKIYNVKWGSDTVNKNTILPDYILIFGNQDKINLPQNQMFKDFVANKTVKCYESWNRYCCVFEVKKNK